MLHKLKMFFQPAAARALLAALAFTSPALAEPQDVIDPEEARAAFDEALQVSETQGGRIWGEALYGPMFFIDPETRAVVANEPGGDGALQKYGDVYVGKLPEDILIANTTAEWAGKRWTMMLWPPPEETFTRRVMFAHELFHRIQPKLGLDAPDTPNVHLDAAEGRLWLQLEWRALAAALAADGEAQTQAIRDALAFRDKRRSLFPGAAKSESSLEIAEGVPEYAGLAAAAPDADAARWRTIAKLTGPDPAISFVRAFAYNSGPPYGLLLDQRRPGWRKELSKKADLGGLLEETLPDAAPVSADDRAAIYGMSAIELAESDRAAKAAALQAKYRALLVDGPTLTLKSAGSFRFSFNPSTLIALGDIGSVYPTFHATDAWGTLDVTDGALVPTDYSSATVAAPADIEGPHIEGPGWTLDLAPGWRLAPSPEKSGSYIVEQK